MNATETENSHPQGSAPTLEPMFLLLLYNEGRHVTRLLQLNLAKLAAESDKALFKILHEEYKRLKKPWLSWISLRTLDSINFVYFEAYRSELVDVRKKDDLPSPGDKEYRYLPAPPELIPPIGSHYLVHVLQYPECAEEESLCMSRFPKKLKEQLRCRGGMKPGWGLQIVECWDAQKIWLLIFMFFQFLINQNPSKIFWCCITMTVLFDDEPSFVLGWLVWSLELPISPRKEPLFKATKSLPKLFSNMR
jgi:hypothetical protein